MALQLVFIAGNQCSWEGRDDEAATQSVECSLFFIARLGWWNITATRHPKSSL